MRVREAGAPFGWYVSAGQKVAYGKKSQTVLHSVLDGTKTESGQAIFWEGLRVGRMLSSCSHFKTLAKGPEGADCILGLADPFPYLLAPTGKGRQTQAKRPLELMLTRAHHS